MYPLYFLYIIIICTFDGLWIVWNGVIETFAVAAERYDPEADDDDEPKVRHVHNNCHYHIVCLFPASSAQLVAYLILC